MRDLRIPGLGGTVLSWVYVRSAGATHGGQAPWAALSQCLRTPPNQAHQDGPQTCGGTEGRTRKERKPSHTAAVEHCVFY